MEPKPRDSISQTSSLYALILVNVEGMKNILEEKVTEFYSKNKNPPESILGKGTSEGKRTRSCTMSRKNPRKSVRVFFIGSTTSQYSGQAGR
jgi:hypothetical protein